MIPKTGNCPTCGRPMKQRSSKQNRSMFGLPYKLLAAAISEQWGEVVTVDRVHEMCKSKFEDILIEYRIDEPVKTITNVNTGQTEEIELAPSTAKLSTIGMMKYYEALQKWGAEFWNIDIPAPNEVDYRKIQPPER